MPRRQAQELFVGLDGVVVLLELELDVPLGRQHFGRLLAVLDGRVQLAQRFLALAFQVQRDGAGQRRRYRLSIGPKPGRVRSVFPWVHGYQLPLVERML
jgi:hypothetical protein